MCAISRSMRGAAAGFKCAARRAASGPAARSRREDRRRGARLLSAVRAPLVVGGAHRVRPRVLAGRDRLADDAPLLSRRAGVAPRLQLQPAVAADSVGDAGNSGAAHRRRRDVPDADRAARARGEDLRRWLEVASFLDAGDVAAPAGSRTITSTWRICTSPSVAGCATRPRSGPSAPTWACGSIGSATSSRTGGPIPIRTSRWRSTCRSVSHGETRAQPPVARAALWAGVIAVRPRARAGHRAAHAAGTACAVAHRAADRERQAGGARVGARASTAICGIASSPSTRGSTTRRASRPSTPVAWKRASTSARAARRPLRTCAICASRARG